MMKKYSQSDLRRLMNEKKQQTAQPTTTKINSPLAKYNQLGQLTCVLCKTIVRSEDVWKVHINAKQHKQNVEATKELKIKLNSGPSTSVASKRAAASPIVPPQPEKIPKGILKNAAATSTTPSFAKPAKSPSSDDSNKFKVPANVEPISDKLPMNFFESTLKKTSIKSDLVNIKRATAATEIEKVEPIHEVEEISDQSSKDEALPEGFFDDPIKDAKARNSDYKDPVEEEWEKFQQEIKEASNFSNTIIAVDQEEATTERQIDEIDEQIKNWERVLQMEKKMENVNVKIKKDVKLPTRDVLNESKTNQSSDDSEDSDSDISGIDEYLDWRTKKAYK